MNRVVVLLSSEPVLDLVAIPDVRFFSFISLSGGDSNSND